VIALLPRVLHTGKIHCQKISSGEMGDSEQFGGLRAITENLSFLRDDNKSMKNVACMLQSS
jgi:hypothetical protein